MDRTSQGNALAAMLVVVPALGATLVVALTWRAIVTRGVLVLVEEELVLLVDGLATWRATALWLGRLVGCGVVGWGIPLRDNGDRNGFAL